MSELKKIALQILSNGKGILAADESTATMTKRLDSVKYVPMKIIDCFLDKPFFIFINERMHRWSNTIRRNNKTKNF